MPPLAAPQTASVGHGTLERDDIRAIPVLSHALGQSADRTWQVDGLLSTLESWYLARSDEARRLEAARASSVSELRHVRSELEALRESSDRRAGVSERTTAEGDRNRRERDALRCLRMALSSAPRPRLDPYESSECEPPTSDVFAAPEGDVHRWARHSAVEMPPLAGPGTGVPYHPGYCPPGLYSPHPEALSGGADR